MKKCIKETQSLIELREFLLSQKGLLEDKNSYFINNLIRDWVKKIISKKLIEFHEEELAQQIDAINPNQSKYEVCKDIIKIILDEQSEMSASSKDTNTSFWGDFLDYLLSHPGTRHI